MQTETDATRAGGKNEERAINKDAQDGEVCKVLREKIKRMKSELELVKLDTTTIRNKCRHLKREIEFFQK